MKKIKQLTKQLIQLGTRQGRSVLKAEKIICGFLDAEKIRYTKETFTASTPDCTAKLIVDGRTIPCAGSSFSSGKISPNALVISSLIPSRYNRTNPNINYNPKATVLSRPNFYLAPSIAVETKNIKKIIEATTLRGVVKTQKITTTVSHILIGNKVNPETILFAHYDSIGPGAIDNTSGVALVLLLALRKKELLEKILIVLDPNEELSYDGEVYWGHGFRVFETRYKKLMKSVKRLIPVDCVGNSETTISTDPAILKLAFPIKNFEKMLPKMMTLYGDIDDLMRVYHSEKDLGQTIKQKYIEDAYEKLLSLI